jgi:hypothetical protein
VNTVAGMADSSCQCVKSELASHHCQDVDGANPFEQNCVVFANEEMMTVKSTLARGRIFDFFRAFPELKRLQYGRDTRPNLGHVAICLI